LKGDPDMKTIHIGDDENRNQKEDEENSPPKSIQDLKDRISVMSLYAEVEVIGSRVLVRVHKDMGTTMYLATMGDDIGWLQFHSYKIEKKPTVTLYYFRF